MHRTFGVVETVGRRSFPFEFGDQRDVPHLHPGLVVTFNVGTKRGTHLRAAYNVRPASPPGEGPPPPPGAVMHQHPNRPVQALSASQRAVGAGGADDQQQKHRQPAGVGPPASGDSWKDPFSLGGTAAESVVSSVIGLLFDELQ